MKTSYPDLKFVIDKEYDEWTSREFLTYDPTDRFSNDILKVHPELEKGKILNQTGRATFIINHIGNYYKKYHDLLESKKNESQASWKIIEKKFYNAVDTLFQTSNAETYAWPAGTYVCALSIFNCNPRDIKNKDFQIFFLHSYGIPIAAMHEMLHFAFYDYVEKTHKELFKNLGTNGMWKLSEIFNDVILRTPKFVKLTNVANPSIYAQTEEELEKYSKMWEESKSIDEFLKKYSA